MTAEYRCAKLQQFINYFGGIEQEFSGDFHQLLIRLIGHEDLRGVLTTGRSALAKTDQGTDFDLGMLGFVQFL